MVDDNLLPTDTCHYFHFLILLRNFKLIYELVKHFCHLPGLIFVNAMTTLVQHYQLEFTLHLSNSQLLVHPVTSSQQQLFRYSHIQKTLGKTLKPLFPVVFCCHQVCSPSVFSNACTNLLHLYNLVRHANSSTL